MTAPEIKIFDTHAHLLDPVYDGDRTRLIEAAAGSGLFIIESALNPAEWKAAAALSEKYANLRFTAGIHPHDASKTQDIAAAAAELGKSTEHPGCVAVGEAGLDYHYKNSSPGDQKKVFDAQIKLAVAADKPLVVHCREAYEDCLAMLGDSAPGLRGVVHCFSGGWDTARKFLDMGFMLGIDGPVTYKKAETLRDTVSRAPLEMLLSETDCPYLSPVPLRGKRNEPANVRIVLEEIARVKNIPYAAAASATTANARRLFGIEL